MAKHSKQSQDLLQRVESNQRIFTRQQVCSSVGLTRIWGGGGGDICELHLLHHQLLWSNEANNGVTVYLSAWGLRRGLRRTERRREGAGRGDCTLGQPSQSEPPLTAGTTEWGGVLHHSGLTVLQPQTWALSDKELEILGRAGGRIMTVLWLLTCHQRPPFTSHPA